MTINKLVLLHNMSSSSDALRSKKTVDERKLMLKKELGNGQSLRERALDRAALGRSRSLRSNSIGNIDDDENVIPKPPSSSSMSTESSGPRFRGRPLSSVERLDKLRQTQTISIKNCNLDDPIISIGSSSSTLEFPAEEGSALPSAKIRNLLQRAAPIENGNGRGGALVKRLIEEQQAKTFRDDQDENDKEVVEKDLRSIYQRYLSGEIEKECVVRSGTEWTSGYRNRRRQRAHQKLRQDSGKTAKTESPAKDDAKLNMVARRYQRKLIPFQETTADHQQQPETKLTRRARYSL